MENLIDPIIEYLEISHADSKRGANWELFSEAIDEGTSSHYLSAVKKRMTDESGIYIFYDSIGRAIYVGKAEKQSLWKEANNAFNRDRHENQKIWMVEHPTSNVKKVNLNRKIKEISVPLSHIAAYFSAYSVAKENIPQLEAFLIRAFANNLMNKRMETFRISGADKP